MRQEEEQRQETDRQTDRWSVGLVQLARKTDRLGRGGGNVRERQADLK